MAYGAYIVGVACIVDISMANTMLWQGQTHRYVHQKAACCEVGIVTENDEHHRGHDRCAAPW